MEAAVLDRKVKRLPFKAHREVSDYLDFLFYKYRVENEIKVSSADFDSNVDDNHFLDLSLLSLSKEWNSSEDEEWDTILSQMPSIP